MDLAAWAARPARRDRSSAITGSVGKTSTKDLIAAAVGAGRRVAANERSFNNEQGLPVTILGAPDDTEVLVLEMGMRGFGEIARLCDVARPTIGVVTAVAAAHTERVGGIDGVARAKAELVEALPADGTASSTPTTSGCVAMAGRTPASVADVRRASATPTCGSTRPRARRARPAVVHASTRRGGRPRSRSPSAARTWRQRRRGDRRRRRARRRLDGAAAALAARRAVGDAHGGPPAGDRARS